ncbi:MAG: ATP-binding protein [Nitrospirota bacterium]|nr:ATP-binding protein [Nitrospirota bacterium]
MARTDESAAADGAVPSTASTPDTVGATAHAAAPDFPGRLLTRLLVPYTALILIAFTIAGFLFLRAARDTLDNALSARLIGQASMVAGTLKPEYLVRLGPGDEQTRLYALILHELKGMREAAGVDDVFVIDRQGRVLVDVDQELPIGAEYLFLKLDAVELAQVWQGEAAASTLYADESGALYKSGYAPVRDAAGKVVAAVGVEAGAGYLSAVNLLRDKVLYLILTVTVLAALISVALSRSIIGPVQRLVAAFSRVVEGHAYPSVPVTTRDEMGYLSHAFNRMTGSLREKDAELTRLYELERERAERIQGLSVQVLEGISSGVLAVDLGGRVLLCNQAAAEIMPVRGYPFPDTGIPPHVRDVLEADSPVLHCLMETLEQHREFLRNDRTWSHPDGQERVLGISAFPLSDRDGGHFGAITIFSDLTEVARLQDQIKIQDRLAALGELSAGIAHEIRNPLGAIRGFVELLGRKVDDPRGKQIVDSILTEVTGLNHIVTDFLAFAREPVLSIEPVDPGEVLRDALAMALPPETNGRLRVTERIEDGLPEVRMDPAQVKNALVNIIQNAATAMGPEGGQLDVAMAPEGNGIEIRVQDSGPGIPQELREKIFNPFFTTRADGTGLGLPIANKVVEGHAGRIRVESPRSGGACFVIWLPTAGPPTTRPTHADEVTA